PENGVAVIDERLVREKALIAERGGDGETIHGAVERALEPSLGGKEREDRRSPFRGSVFLDARVRAGVVPGGVIGIDGGGEQQLVGANPAGQGQYGGGIETTRQRYRHPAFERVIVLDSFVDRG